jgi:catechol 2,3-dioxygenase-like lactoylglutathione lyase family enzyme
MAREIGENELAFVQIGMNSNDMVATLRLYSQLFGFSNAGGAPAWGDNLRVQGLGPDAHMMMWWMVGDQPFFQLEFFTHGNPAQRPLRDDWRPTDHGWVRFGVAIADFDRVAKGLDRLAIPVLGTGGSAPNRRLAFRDPQVGCIVEVIERPGGASPEVTYAATSVADLEAARTLYGKTLGLELAPLEELHGPGDEAMWGLAGARRDGFLVKLPGGVLEVLQYSDPVGRPRPADYRTSDQGIVNVGIGTRTKPLIQDAIQRVQNDGRTITYVLDMNGLCATYSVDPGYEIEFLSVPRELDAFLGYAKSVPFLAEPWD